MAVSRCKILLSVIHQRTVFSGITCNLLNQCNRKHFSTNGDKLGSSNPDPVANSTEEAKTDSLIQKEEAEHSEYEENIKNNILKASLPFVEKCGWSKETISHGAESLGYPGVAHGMFPRGGAELVQYFYVSSNQELVEILKQFVGETSEDPNSPNEATNAVNSRKDHSTNTVISFAVETRLRMIEPYLNHWPQALAIMTLPPNVPTSLANLLTLVDDIWYYAGDRSVDFNWYSRRVALAGIYKMTELYMIQDGSHDHQNTWQFLHKRLDEASQINSFLVKGESATQFAKDIAAATFITARNILGLNWNR
ncbi:ubiquinone biosynthesis protein COQ9, mitochondrial isoform X2 [Nilaparvata lugens]|uniref:ubiquinone biosynthesis protein COQ9, mitochondrial isoform X2 n=1 Tax=Nilaparvata lugens TaxID=108931 RepID=UPI00193EC1C7|nr:ubiquinone biosynthesis protein COQ9, mitochondrial isoform X2 [Nilaparvata lugens]